MLQCEKMVLKREAPSKVSGYLVFRSGAINESYNMLSNMLSNMLDGHNNWISHDVLCRISLYNVM